MGQVVNSTEQWRRIQALAEQGDTAMAVKKAHALLNIKPRNRKLLENMTVFFLECGALSDARSALDFLHIYFTPQSFWLVLQTRLAFLEARYCDVIKLADVDIDNNDLDDWQKALLYNDLAFSYLELGQIDKAIDAAKAASRLPKNPSRIYDYSNVLFNLHYRYHPQSEIYSCIKAYDDFFLDIKPYTHQVIGQHTKIRVGYVSADFCYSVVAFFVYAMLKFYDKNKFEVYVYAKCEEDLASREFAASVTKWENILHLSPFEAAKKIYDDEIDILFDLSGHTANNCLPILAYKPAPIQMSGIGWFDSTGLSAVDYFLTDIYVDPPGKNDEFFTEKLVRLPHSHFCYMWHSKPAVPAPAPCVDNGFIIFGSLNRFAKVTDEILNVWGKILRGVPGSKLFLKSKTFDSADGRQIAWDRIREAGIAENSVMLDGFSDDYLEAYKKIDIALDTFPYPGGGTTCDALYMGVPVVTLVGESHNSRFGYSLLKNVGLEELCAFSMQEYIDICISLANDRDRLFYLHLTLREQMEKSPLMDAKSYMRALEAVYEKLVREKVAQPVALWQQYVAAGYEFLRHGDYTAAENAYRLAGKQQVDLPMRLSAVSSYLLTSHYQPYSTQEISRRQKIYADLLKTTEVYPKRIRYKHKNEKLRIGYISADFRNHAMFPIYYGLMACYDKTKFHVVCYQLNDRSDAFTQHLQSMVDDWQVVSGLDADAIAHKIYQDDIDILVDLAGHSLASGLPALVKRPATIQISGLGTLCTTGVNFVDYFITDEIVDPPGMHDAFYTESMLYMPCQFSYAGRNDVPASMGAPCSSKGYIQLGCFQEYSKVTDEMLTAWQKIMLQLPKSRLLMKSIPFEIAEIRQSAYVRMTEAGLPMERITLEVGDEDYMQRMLDVDIMLDTYPYPGGRTTLDALYMGVPVVSLYGERRNTRFGFSILHAIGLDELAVSSISDYIDCVTALASNEALLDLLHKNLRDMLNRSQALSPQHYARNMEKAYQDLAIKHDIYYAAEER